MSNPKLVSVDASNVGKYGIFCVKNPRHPGFKAKRAWLEDRWKEGLRILLVHDEDAGSLAFLEYTHGEHAWRPVKADGYLFIHCLFIMKKEHTGKGYAGRLIDKCLEDARNLGKSGVAVVASEGPWMAHPGIFEKKAFVKVDKKDRFDLLAYKLQDVPDPVFKQPSADSEMKGNGWQLHYAHQCPMHAKCVEDISNFAKNEELDLETRELTSPAQAQDSPNGFGVLTVFYNNEVVADNYVSKARFKNILRAKS